MSQNTNKPLRVSDCHRAALAFKDGEVICSVCKQPCLEVELLVEEEDE